MSDDVLERVRMCIAEAGYDPDEVWEPDRPGAAFSVPGEWPEEIGWRARELAGIGNAACLACTLKGVEQIGRGVIPDGDCLADRRLVEDCGVTRD